MRICPDLVKNSLNKTSLFIQCPCKQNFVFRIKSEKEKPVLKDFVFIRIFVHFTRIFMPVGTKTPYTLQQTWKFPLQVCFFVITRHERVKGALSSLKQFWATESCLKMMENALNAFYFTSNILFVLKIFKFLSWLFGHISKQLDQKDQVNFKIYEVTAWLTNYFNNHIIQYYQK